MAKAQGPFYEDLGRRLAKARRDRKVTQAAIAESCSLSRASVVNIERGRQPVSVQTLVRWCSALNVNLESVVPRAPEVQTAMDARTAEGLDRLPPKERSWVEQIASLGIVPSPGGNE